MINVYEQIDRNKFRSNLVVGLFLVFIVFVTWILAHSLGYGPASVGTALVIAGVTSFVGYRWSDRIILGISGARPADKRKNFVFFTVVENLAMAAQIPMPKLFIIEDSAPNAFATGRDPNHAVVCATTGLLQKLDRSELEGVVAHELSHVKSYDTRLMSIVAVFVGIVTLLADWLLRGFSYGGRDKQERGGRTGTFLFLLGIILALFSPIIARLIQLAISRRREFFADASAVMLTRYPEGLVRALEEIAKDKEPLEAANKATAHLYIENPLRNHHDSIGWFANLFNTHPPVEERIKILREMT